MALKDIRAWRRWLAKQRDREDPVGDFARDFLDDPDTRGLNTTSAIDRYLSDLVGTDDAVLNARDRAWREYAGRWPDRTIKRRIVDALKASSSGMTRTEVRDLFGRNVAAYLVSGALDYLRDVGLASARKSSTGGRPVETWTWAGDYSVVASSILSEIAAGAIQLQTGRDGMLRIYKNASAGGNGEFVVVTDAASIEQFVDPLGEAILKALDEFEGDREFTITGILTNALEIAFKLKGYKADRVQEQKVLSCGYSSPEDCNLVAEVGVRKGTEAGGEDGEP